MTIKKLFEALALATRGQRVVYHTGLLMRDRQHDADLNALASAAWELFKRREALLFQRRVSEGICDYFIVKAREA